MAIIAEDSPAKEKTCPAEIVITINEQPANEGFCTDKTTKVFQEPDNIQQEPEKELLPPPEITTEPEPPNLLQVQEKVKKKRKKQRKRKSKKIKAVLLVKGPRTKPGILSGKFHLKLPKKAIGNRLFFAALCSVLSYQLAQSAVISSLSVPVSDLPLTLSHNGQRTTFQNPKFCPENVPISDSCAACFEETSLLKILCSNAADIKIWGEPRKGNGDVTFVTMTSNGCKYFVNKSQKLRKKRSRERSPGADLKGNKETSVEEKKKNLKTDTYDNEICTFTVPVSDSSRAPIVITKDQHSEAIDEITFCPRRVKVLENYSTCFKSETLLEISCRKNGNEDLGSLWVEHGMGYVPSTRVDMNAAECHKIAANVSQAQSHQSDGGTSSKSSEGNNGQSLQNCGMLLIPIFFFATIFVFAIVPVRK